MNITLIGMPGSGKSFIGARLAKVLGFSFIDPDKILEDGQAKPLQEILQSLGEEMFLHTEADLSVTALKDADNTVLATGGSIIYSQEAMEELQRLSTIVYLEVDFETLQQRVGDTPRGIVGLGERTFTQLFRERTPLYEKWALVRVDGSQSLEKVIADIQSALDSDTSFHSE